MEPRPGQDRASQRQQRVSVACPRCGQGYQIAARFVGRRLVCRHCRQEWRAQEIPHQDFRSGQLIGAGSSSDSDSGTTLLPNDSQEAGSGSSSRSTVIDTRWTGKKLGRYQVRSVLGHGGMGVVYRAHDDNLRRDVALKILNRQSGNCGGLDAELFMQEARAIAKLQHPSVVSVFEVAQDNGQIFLALELMEGGTLKEYVQRYGRIPPRELWAQMVGPARALALAHRRGIIHRDIKPGNLIFDDHGHLKLMDFGLADVAQDAASERIRGKAVGSLGWLAPETARGQGTTASSDIYSLGLAMLYALNGRVWLTAPSRGELMTLHQNPPPLRLGRIRGLTPRAASVIEKCLAIEQADRFLTADRLADALLECADEDPAKLSQQRKRHAWVAVIAAVCGGLLVGGGVLHYFNRLFDRQRELELPVISKRAPADFGPDAQGLQAPSPDGKARVAAVSPSEASEGSVAVDLRRPWPNVYGDSDFKFVGSKRARVFHLATGKCGRSILASNLEIFGSVEEALEAGWKPCLSCRPAESDPVNVAAGPDQDGD